MTNSGISYRVRNRYEMQLNLKGIKANTILRSNVSGLHILITEINLEGLFLQFRSLSENRDIIYLMPLSTFLAGNWEIQ
jgi:hypothetical protein